MGQIYIKLARFNLQNVLIDGKCSKIDTNAIDYNGSFFLQVNDCLRFAANYFTANIQASDTLHCLRNNNFVMSLKHLCLIGIGLNIDFKVSLIWPISLFMDDCAHTTEVAKVMTVTLSKMYVTITELCINNNILKVSIEW